VGLKFICNASDWLKDEWILEAMSCKGFNAPADLFQKEKQELHKEDIRVKEAGYSLDAFYYTLIEKSHLTFNLPPIPRLPKGEIHWWITKMMPGQFMPVHQDPRITTKKNIKRYWMPWTDWECGHIFTYEDTVMGEYSKGDIFLMEDPDALHGAANIGLTPRITLNIGVEML
jgi:hypothetical protein